jgi:hypothetical protein
LEPTNQGKKSQQVKNVNMIFFLNGVCCKNNSYFIAFQTLLVVHALITTANGKFFNV